MFAWIQAGSQLQAPPCSCTAAIPLHQHYLMICLPRLSSFTACLIPRQLLPPSPPAMLLLAPRWLLLAWHGMPACAASSAHADTDASSTCRPQS
jgi:hypothetical protein